jgi:hypothetical protein
MNYPALFFAGVLMGGTHLRAEVVLNEIVSRNNLAGFLAADGLAYDWIELHNNGAEEVDLQGSFLTDDPITPNKWEFTRSFPIPAGGYAIVFASDRNAVIEGQEHLNFRLDAGDGEYLALIASDGVTVKDEYSPQFSPLRSLHSFGVPASGGSPGVLLSATPNAANSEAAPVPIIQSFTTSAEVIANGESVTLTWETENGTWVALDSSLYNNTPVEAIGSTILRPTLTQEVTLIVRNEFSEVRETINILVGPAVNEFTASPTTIATGGQTVLRWDTVGSGQLIELDGFTVTGVNPPTNFIPSNLNLIPVDSTWKQASVSPPEGWQALDFDDSEWLEIDPPFVGKGHFRKTFELANPASLATGVLRLVGDYGSIVTLNGETIFDPTGFFGNPSAIEGDFRIAPSLFRTGTNVLAVQPLYDLDSHLCQLGAWQSHPVDTIVPVVLKSSNLAGAASKTINITVLAEEAPLPPLPTVAISEIFWSYFGTFPVEPYRFFEVQNCGTEPIDLTGIQLIGSSFFAFSDSNDPLLAPGKVAVVVAHHPSFSEIWPGDRNVVGQIEDPDETETYIFDFNAALLDSFGRVFEEVSTQTLPEFGDIYQPYERANPKASSKDPENWFVARGQSWNGPGQGTPGELPFRIIDFSFDPPFASPGDLVSLTWEVSREATLEISDGIGPVTGTKGSIDLVVPEDARSFRFWLDSATTFASYQQLAILNLPPSISFFDVSKTSIVPGEEITFRWIEETNRTERISISPEDAPGPTGTGLYGRSYDFTPLIAGFKKGDYWRTRAHPSAPEAEWNSAGYIAPWRIRRGIIGYGDERVDYDLTSNGWLTAHFSRSFHVREINEVNGVFLDLLNDDGIEIHLNGQEVLRDNLPAGEIDHLTPALSKMDPTERTFEIDPSYLVEGQNIITIALHNSAIDDDNLIFDLGLRAQRPVPASGKKTYTFNATNSAGSDSAQVTILFQEPQELSDWQTDNGLAGDATTTDTDGDDLSDFLEFMTGSDPNTKSPHPITLTQDEDGHITVSYPHNLAAGNNKLSLQNSLNLKNWYNLIDFKFEGSVAPADSDIAEVRYRSYSPIREARYFRLHAN